MLHIDLIKINISFFDLFLTLDYLLYCFLRACFQNYVCVCVCVCVIAATLQPSHVCVCVCVFIRLSAFIFNLLPAHRDRLCPSFILLSEASITSFRGSNESPQSPLQCSCSQTLVPPSQRLISLALISSTLLTFFKSSFFLLYIYINYFMVIYQYIL